MGFKKLSPKRKSSKRMSTRKTVLSKNKTPKRRTSTKRSTRRRTSPKRSTRRRTSTKRSTRRRTSTKRSTRRRTSPKRSIKRRTSTKRSIKRRTSPKRSTRRRTSPKRRYVKRFFKIKNSKRSNQKGGLKSGMQRNVLSRTTLGTRTDPNILDTILVKHYKNGRRMSDGIQALRDGEELIFTSKKFYPLQDSRNTIKEAIDIKSTPINDAQNDVLNMTMRLHQQRQLDRTAMDELASNGFIKALMWLHNENINTQRYIKPYTVTVNAVNNAATYGYLDILIWLYDNYRDLFTETAMVNAARNRHFEAVKFIHGKFTPPNVNANVINAAVYGGINNMVEWLISKGYHWNNETLTILKSARRTNKNFGVNPTNGNIKDADEIELYFEAADKNDKKPDLQSLKLNN